MAGDYVFVLANDNELVCLTRNDGQGALGAPAAALSRTKRKRSDPILWAGPVLGGDRLIVLSSPAMRCSVSPYTGELLGSRRCRPAAISDR